MEHWTKHEEVVALVVTVAFFAAGIYEAIDLYWFR